MLDAQHIAALSSPSPSSVHRPWPPPNPGPWSSSQENAHWEQPGAPDQIRTGLCGSGWKGHLRKWADNPWEGLEKIGDITKKTTLNSKLFWQWWTILWKGKGGKPLAYVRKRIWQGFLVVVSVRRLLPGRVEQPPLAHDPGGQAQLSPLALGELGPDVWPSWACYLSTKTAAQVVVRIDSNRYYCGSTCGIFVCLGIWWCFLDSRVPHDWDSWRGGMGPLVLWSSQPVTSLPWTRRTLYVGEVSAPGRPGIYPFAGRTDWPHWKSQPGVLSFCLGLSAASVTLRRCFVGGGHTSAVLMQTCLCT